MDKRRPDVRYLQPLHFLQATLLINKLTNLLEEFVSLNVFWPDMRWPGSSEPECSSINGHNAYFFNNYSEVSDDMWTKCDAIVAYKDAPPEIREKLTNCKIFVTPKVGYDNIDIQAWGAQGAPVCNVPDYGTQEVADHAIALMLSIMRSVTFHTRELKKSPDKLWRPALNPFSKRLSTCVFGVVGLGRIGTAAALRAKAFGMDVVMYDPNRENGAELSVGIRRVHSLNALFSQSDVVSIHTPHSQETDKLINANVLKSSKRNLILVNTARGSVVDLDALYDALRNDTIQAVALDVLPEEPANPEHPLIKAWAADEAWIDHRLLLTPHSAFFTPESALDMRTKPGQVIVDYLDFGRLTNCVNLDWLK